MNLHLWLIPILPLAGAAINGLFGRWFSKRLVAGVALFFTALSFGVAAIAALRLVNASMLVYTELHGIWIHAGDFNVPFGFLLDHLSLVMILVVTGVGFLIHIYSVAYMEHEGGYYRFFCYLNLFMFFMLVLVLADNYLLMFVGWEGVGLASYLLIGFFFLKDSAANAGKKAFITNRVGDFGFLIALLLLIRQFGSLQYSEIFNAISHSEAGVSLLTAIGLLMLVGAAGKSAQIPLYVWLPDAMEGPTPVSALIHAATMVTAGVYMVCRSNPIFSRAPMALLAVAVIGCLTSFFAATIGITQTDIKRVLAYSTVSQLGYMFMAAGVAAYSAAIFHLMTHAFFKALLFLGAGAVIHGVGGEQDMRKMGGLRKYMPKTFWVMLIATLAISGIPPFAGFFSKDEILWQALNRHWLLWLFGAVTAFITSFYMFRLIFMTFTGEYRGATSSADTHGHGAHVDHGHGAPHESPWMMLGPLVVLAFLSLVGGWVGIPPSIPRLFGIENATNHFEHFLAPVISAVSPEANATVAESGNLELIMTLVSALIAVAGLGLAWLLYVKRRDLPGRIAAALGGIYQLVLNKYWIDELYGAAVIGPIIAFSRSVLWQGVDARAIDGSVNFGAEAAQDVSDAVRHQQSGNIRSYAGWIAAGAALVVIYMVWMGTR